MEKGEMRKEGRETLEEGDERNDIHIHVNI